MYIYRESPTSSSHLSHIHLLSLFLRIFVSIKMEEDLLQHVLFVCFPGQGHVNPLLRLAKRVASEGLFVTFSTNVATGLKMLKATNTSTNTPIPLGNGFLRFDFFDDGWDPNNLDFDAFMVNLNSVGPRAVTDLICRQVRPVSFIISNPFLPWVVDVAAEMGIRSGVLWVQSCAVFSAYHHYFHSRSIFPDSEQGWKDVEVKLPALPVLRADDLPNFLLPAAPFRFLGDIILEQFANLSKVSWVLVDSFQELEQPIMESMLAVSPPARLIPVGPLYKLANRSDLNGVRGDLWKTADCLGWLDSHPPSSVIYISFGSVVVLEREQLEEIARGLQDSGRPFLWVVKPIENTTETGLPEGFVEETAGRGMVVKWCPQEKVLSHPSVACFMTHCGWNSSMESLSSGVPIIAFPQFGDQTTNAKFLVDVYGVGVRLRAEEALVRKEEVVRCVEEMFTGERAEEMTGNALKWKDKAGAAVREDGSSERNVKDIVDDLKRGSPNRVDPSSKSQWETGVGKVQVGFGSLEGTSTLLCQ